MDWTPAPITELKAQKIWMLYIKRFEMLMLAVSTIHRGAEAKEIASKVQHFADRFC